MNAAVFGELWVKRRSEDAPRANEYGIIIAAGKDFNARPYVTDSWRANEDHLHRASGQHGGRVENDRVILPAVCVPLNRNVEYGEAALRRVRDLFRKQDAAGAGSEDGPGAYERVKDVVEAGAFEVLEEGAGFASRDNQPVEVGEIVRLADEVRGGAQFGEPLCVDVKGALESEDADLYASLDAGPGRIGAHPSRVAVWLSSPTTVLLRIIDGFAYRFAREKNH